jgi:hypothetical protein
MAITTNISQAEYKTQLASVFDTLQQQRSSLLSMAREVQLAARVLVITEGQRLTAAVGADDPRVGRYNSNSDVMLSRINALAVEKEIADIRVPPIAKTETLVQGRVTDESARAIEPVTVTLVDDRRAPIAGVEPVDTDSSGYFAFVLKPEDTKAIGSRRKLSVVIEREGVKVRPAAARPFTLTPGAMPVNELKLAGEELEKLGLRAGVAKSPRAERSAKRPSVKRGAGTRRKPK